MKIAKKIVSWVLAIVMGLGCFTLFSFAEETENTEHLTEVPEGYIGIYTKTDLDNIKLDMAGKYILMNDIVFEDSDYEKGGDFYNSGKGWEPIGTVETPFTGTFDGNNYKIKNLYINNPSESYIGLFGYSNTCTAIQNLNIVDSEITGNEYVGGIIGYLYSKAYSNCSISNCNFIGSVIGTNFVGGIAGVTNNYLTVSHCNVSGAVSGKNSIGGIVGFQFTSPTKGQTCKNYIKYCNNAADITAEAYGGGIVGTAQSYYYQYYVSGSYSSTYYIGETYAFYCMNSGKVTVETNGAGGIVGRSTDQNGHNGDKGPYRYVENCANIGDITADGYAGGLIGMISNNYSIIKNSYNIGTVTANSYFGGCFGNAPHTCTFTYYLDESVVNPTCITGIAKSEDQLRKQTTFEQWDFNTVWTMGGRDDYKYPELIDAPLVLPEDSVHNHEYSSEITTPATHTSEGIRTYTCECGDTYTESIAKLEGHTYTSTVTKEPTHLEEGIRTYTCECKESYTETIDKIADHSYKATITKPTCTEQGYTTYTCECGDSYVADYIDKNGHKHESAITTPATHTSEGVMTFTCHCGDSYTKVIGKTTEHNYKAVVTKPTCEDKGYTTYICECGDSYVTNYKGATGHDYDSGIVTTKPTCTKSGTKTFTCSNCGDTYTETVKALGHNHKSKITTPATHLKEGITTFTCACGDSYTKTVAKLEEHSYTAVITDPTCYEKGFTTYTCECGDTYVADYVDTTGHSEGDNNGNCSACGEHICDHKCHKSGITGFFWKIICFFHKLFGTNKVCECGALHY